MSRMTAGTHEAAVAALREAYAALPPGTPVRLAKRTSNLFRFRDAAPVTGLDLSAFGRVLRVDPETRTAQVGGMTTYEDLADATLRHHLMPLGVPQLKTITLGGAVTGLGIESTSLRNGLPHESVTEMEILTGDGRVVRATADNEHAALFRGFPNSYGTLGYALSLTIELEPVKPFVHVRHLPFGTPEACMEAVAQAAAEGSLRGHRADFIDGIAFAPDELYLTVGSFSDVAPWRSDYTGQQIYYQSVRRDKEDSLRSATTYGGGTPTGSGARGRSACNGRWSGGCGRAATGDPTCTTSSSR
jgi:FAD/FMN-containing dehydrogenase